MLAEASGLGTLVAEDRQAIGELDRLTEVGHAVLEVGAADGGSALGPQGETVAAAILEDVHLLFDDVGPFADAAREQVGVLERRRFDEPKPASRACSRA